MFMVVHAAVGAAAGQAVSHKSAAFLLGVISHFFLDMIPHGDERIYQDWIKGKRMRRARLHVGIDVILTVIFVAALFWTPQFANPTVVAWGVVGGLLPDVMVGVSLAMRPKRAKGLAWRLDRYNKFHRWNHTFLMNHWKRVENDIPFVSGLFYQGVLLFVLIKYVI
jgi:hypothetical protein